MFTRGESYTHIFVGYELTFIDRTTKFILIIQVSLFFFILVTKKQIFVFYFKNLFTILWRCTINLL